MNDSSHKVWYCVYVFSLLVEEYFNRKTCAIINNNYMNSNFIIARNQQTVEGVIRIHVLNTNDANYELSN